MARKEAIRRAYWEREKSDREGQTVVSSRRRQISSRTTTNCSASLDGRILRCARRQAECGEHQTDRSLEKLRQHQQQAKRNQYQQNAGLEVLAAMEKTVPGPHSLGKGRGKKGNRDEHQQDEADARAHARQPSKWRPVCGRVAQISSALCGSVSVMVRAQDSSCCLTRETPNEGSTMGVQ